MLTFDFSDWEIKARRFTQTAQKVPSVIALALTRSMLDAREAERGTMSAVFDQPAPFTLNSMRVVAAEKNKLEAELTFKDTASYSRPAWKWLGPEVHGGARNTKGFELALRSRGILLAGEFVVPGKGIKLNASGNIPGSTIVRILSQLGASEMTAGHTSNMTARSRKAALKRAGGQFFVHRGGKAPNGVYQRVGQKAIPMLIFVKSPQYKARLPYYEVAEATVRSSFARHAQDAWNRHVVRMLERGG